MIVQLYESPPIRTIADDEFCATTPGPEDIDLSSCVGGEHDPPHQCRSDARNRNHIHSPFAPDTRSGLSHTGAEVSARHDRHQISAVHVAQRSAAMTGHDIPNVLAGKAFMQLRPFHAPAAPPRPTATAPGHRSRHSHCRNRKGAGRDRADLLKTLQILGYGPAVNRARDIGCSTAVSDASPASTPHRSTASNPTPSSPRGRPVAAPTHPGSAP